jgi:uncharacterized coiled-coil protein SlyX
LETLTRLQAYAIDRLNEEAAQTRTTLDALNAKLDEAAMGKSQNRSTDDRDE